MGYNRIRCPQNQIEERFSKEKVSKDFDFCKEYNIPLLRLNYLQTEEEIQKEIKKFLDIE